MLAAAQVLSAGADGLVKLWGVRTSECLATFDEHEAKVWALHVAGSNDSTLATGGADARVNIWRDCTAEDEATAAADRVEAAVKGQALANALQVRLMPGQHMGRADGCPRTGSVCQHQGCMRICCLCQRFVVRICAQHRHSGHASQNCTVMG